MAQKPNIFLVFLAFLILFISIPNEVFGQPLILSNNQPSLKGLDAEPYLDSPTRTKIDLAGTWSVTFENENCIDELTGRSTKSEVNVPSSIDFEGRMTFIRTFAIGEEMRKASAFKLVALGINYECEIYVNDIFIGKHTGGYTSFEFEVPGDALQTAQNNTIKIIVENVLNARNTIPVRQQVWGWKHYGGILRDIYILAVPRVFLDSIRVKTEVNEKNGQAIVRIDGALCDKNYDVASNDSAEAKLRRMSYYLSAELHERFTDELVAEGKSEPLLVERNGSTGFQMSIAVKEPKLWSPESPELYILKLSLITGEGKKAEVRDQYGINLGFATVGLEDNILTLNGNKIILKGIVWHEDSPKYGTSVPYDQMEKDIAIAKSLGANAIRCAFHPPHPYLLNLCSRYGILVLEEIPVWNVPGEIVSTDQFINIAQIRAQEMVGRDSHFPCVLAWGIGDQFDSGNELTKQYVVQLAGAIRQMDSRPVYYGTRMLKNDACYSGVDFVGMDLPSSDLKNLRQILGEWKKHHPAQPVVILSYGKVVNQNNRNGYSDPLSQESQARFYLQYYTAFKEAKISGSFVNALADWRSDRPLLNFNFGDYYICPVGLLSQYREKRLAYEVVRQLYNDEHVNVIPAGSYRLSFPIAHVLIGFFIIILIGYQYTNRRFAENLKRSLLRSYNFFVDLRDLHTVSIIHTLILAGAISVTLADLLSNVMYHYRADRFADYLLTLIFISDPVKVRFIQATWHPWIGIAALSGLFFVLGIILALAIRIFAVFIRARVSLLHAYSVSVWSAAPVIFLSPLAMSLFKILENSTYVIPSLAIISIFIFWTFLRILKGISVVYDLSRAKTYTVGILMCVLLAGGLFFYYESVYALSTYVKFALRLAQNPW